MTDRRARGDCLRAREALEVFLDLDADGDVRDFVGAHIGACGDCQRFVASDDRLVTRLHSLPVPRAEVRRFPRAFVPVGIAAAAAAALLIGLLLSARTDPSAPELAGSPSVRIVADGGRLVRSGGEDATGVADVPALAAGDRMETEPRGSLLVAGSGSWIRLEGDSAVSVVDAGPETLRFRLLRGGVAAGALSDSIEILANDRTLRVRDAEVEVASGSDVPPDVALAVHVRRGTVVVPGRSRAATVDTGEVLLVMAGDGASEIVAALPTVAEVQGLRGRLRDRDREVRDLQSAVAALRAAADRPDPAAEPATAAAPASPAADLARVLALADNVTNLHAPAFYEQVAAFRALGPAGAEKLALALSEETSPIRRLFLTRLLSELRVFEAVSALAEAGEDPDAMVRGEAVEGIARLEMSDTAPLLAEIFHRESDAGVKIRAAGGLARLGDRVAAEHLERSFFDPDAGEELRGMAFFRLVRAAQDLSAPFFRRVISDPIGRRFRIPAAEVLGRLRDAESLPALRSLLEEETGVRRELVEQAIRRIQGD